MKKFSLVAACCRSNGIGVNNNLPWRLKNEMNYFSRITTDVLNKNTENPKKNAVIMGMRTYLSIPLKYRPLPDRINVVLSRKSEKIPEGASYMYRSLMEAVEELSKLPDVDQLFVVGGADAYKEAIESPQCEFVFLTRIDADFECDRFFPTVDPELYDNLPADSSYMKLYNIPDGVQQENGLNYRYHLYRRKESTVL